MNKVLKLYGPRDLRYEVEALPDLGDHDVRVRSRLGAISAGTETAWYSGTDPQLEPSFRPGRVPAAGFPRSLGYEKVADVVEVGSEVSSVQEGQRVICRSGHEQERVFTEDDVIAVPDGITDEEAVACSLATVAIHAIRRARLQIGDDVFITGQGFLGLLTVMLGRLAGANRIVVTDPYENRRRVGLNLGADDALDPGAGDLSAELTETYGAGAFDVAFETSSSYEALADAFAAVRRGGRICVVSQLKGSYPKHPALGAEFHLEEQELISSDGRGDVRKLSRWYFEAIRRGALTGIGDLFSHRVPFSEVERGLKLLDREPEAVTKVAVTYD